LNSHLRQLMFDFVMRSIGGEIPSAGARGSSR